MESSLLLRTCAIVAGVISLPAARAVVIDYVPVGNPGNSNDSNGHGAVAAPYQIGKYEVTNAQYAEFLNAVARTDTYGLYNTFMAEAFGGIVRSGASGNYAYTVKANMGNKPVNYVSWYDGARFANWLHNSQPTGLQTTLTTEGGAYVLSGNDGLITKSSTAQVWIPTENEWYKAAYYDPTASGTGNYWLYPTRSDSVPTIAIASVTGDIANPGANVANYGFGADWNGRDGYVTSVGSAGTTSFYGTFDQAGNVWEWNDEIVTLSLARGLRGGSFETASEFSLRSSIGLDFGPAGEGRGVGFRVATIPEPAVTMLALLACGFVRRRRRD